MTAPQSVFPLRSSTGVALVVATVLASTIGFLNAYMINVAVPAIGRDLDADVSAIQWVLTGYLVTVAALLLVDSQPTGRCVPCPRSTGRGARCRSTFPVPCSRWSASVPSSTP